MSEEKKTDTVAGADDLITKYLGGEPSPYLGKSGAKKKSETEGKGKIPKLCKRLLPSVVKITNNLGNKTGTGFIVAGGYVATNAHVVSLKSGNDSLISSDLVISFHPDVSSVAYRAEAVAFDATQDIAILKVQWGEEFAERSVKIANSDKAQVGEEVFTFGNGVGLGIAFTKLYVSQRAGRSSTYSRYDEVLQLAGGTNHGNSGGPVFNLSGEVIGIVTFGHLEKNGTRVDMIEKDGKPCFTQTDNFVVANNLSFAVTSNTLKKIAKKSGIIL